MWQSLRNRNLNGFKIRRQNPIDKLIADFYCFKANLIIELDGSGHESQDQSEYDEGRSFSLAKRNIKVIRCNNCQIENSQQKF